MKTSNARSKNRNWTETCLTRRSVERCHKLCGDSGSESLITTRTILLEIYGFPGRCMYPLCPVNSVQIKQLRSPHAIGFEPWIVERFHDQDDSEST